MPEFVREFTDPIGSLTSRHFDTKVYSIRKPLPVVWPCQPPPPPFFGSLADSWNCNTCGSEKKHSILFSATDIIPFQFRLDDDVNATRQFPTLGWQKSSGAENTSFYVKAKILDCNCTQVYGFVDQFSTEYYVAYSEETGSRQVFWLDCSMLPSNLNCFIILVEQWVRSASNPAVLVEGTYYFSEPFVRDTSEFCVKSTLIESSYECLGTDCFGRLYGQPPSTDSYFGQQPFTPLVDRLRLRGGIEYMGQSVERQTTDYNAIVSQTITKKYRLPVGVVPPYMSQWIGSILAGCEGTLKIGGKVVTGAEVNIERGTDATRMHVINIDFSNDCDLNAFVCS